jgi:predicted esterase
MADSLETLTFSQVRQAMMTHIKAGHPLDAVGVIRQHAPRFPAQQNLFRFWEASLLCQAEQTGEALRILEHMMDEGYWWLPEILTEEEDFAALHNNARFTRIIDKCRSRAGIARATAQPRLEMVTSDDTITKPLPLLIFLHGWGSRPALIKSYFTDLSRRRWLIALPQSSLPVSADTYCWDEAEKAEQEIRRHLDDVMGRFPIDPKRVVIGGFSQGGGLAVKLALNSPMNFAGFLAVAPARINLEELVNPHNEGQSKRGVVLAGALDERWVESATALRDWMEAHQYSCQYQLTPDLRLDLPPDFVPSLRQYLEFITL